MLRREIVHWETFILIWICCTWIINQASPISADLVESIHQHQQTPQRNEIDSEDEDETFLEYHSQDEASISEDGSNDD